MNDISKFLRQKRFSIRQDGGVKLVLETATGARFQFKLENCSLNGVGVSIEGKVPTDERLEPGDLIPSSKLVCGEQETTLGRLVVRRIHSEEGTTNLAFSTIDTRVPVDGLLSRYIAEEIDTRNSAYTFELSPAKFSLANFVETSQTNVDLLQRTKQFNVFHQAWKKTEKFQYNNIRTASSGERVKLKQKRRGDRNDYVVMGSNDYLGLANSPEVKEAAKKAIDDYGFGSTGSPLTTGLTDLHEELCDLLARTFKQESALLFNSGYVANVGTITGLTGAQDLVVADHLSHASIQDGMQMARATSRFFKHNNPKHLDKILRETRSSHVGTLVVTEGVFSMDGDLPPMNEICKVAKSHNARILLDEAHSFGVVGENGLGAWELCGDHKIDIIMGTFSKICGGIGGFIAADKEVVNWLNFFARSHMFSVSIPPSTAAASLAAIKKFLATPELLQNLRGNIRHFTKGLRDLGCPISPNHQSAVIPVVIGDEAKLGVMNQVFRDSGVYVIPIVYPAVGRKNCRFRFTMMATHTISDLDFVLSVIEKAMFKADFTFSQVEDASAAAA